MTESTQVQFEDKFVGCLVGGAVGDALGFVTENLSLERIRTKFGRVSNYKVNPRWGYYTDDTQLTIALAETLIKCGGYDQTYFRRKLARWGLVFPRLSGRSTKNAALKCLVGLQQTGRNVPGSSGAMRAAPLALFYYDDLEALYNHTVECCQVTHVHNSAIAGALVSVFSVAYCLTHKVLNQVEYLTSLADVAKRHDPEISQRLLQLPTFLDKPDDVVMHELLSHSNRFGSPIADIISTAVYAFLKYPEDYERCVLLCVNAGWDTDTMAAIAGNTAGTWHGFRGIPTQWVTSIENGYKGKDYLVALAQSLHERRDSKAKRNVLFDYGADWLRNTAFLFNMLIRKPLW
jgi:ADP-ribosyl-[dinitrogen reductase] hydrolase